MLQKIKERAHIIAVVLERFPDRFRHNAGDCEMRDRAEMELLKDLPHVVRILEVPFDKGNAFRNHRPMPRAQVVKDNRLILGIEKSPDHVGSYIACSADD